MNGTHTVNNKDRRPIGRILVLVSALLVIALVGAGCQAVLEKVGPLWFAGSGGRETSGSTTDPTETGLPESVKDGIRLELFYNQAVWKSGDTVRIRVRLTNITDKPIKWQAGSTSFGAAGSIHLQILLADQFEWRLIEAGEPRMGDTAMLYGQLEPGQSIEKTVEWTTRYSLDGDTEREAWTGVHQLKIEFIRGHDDWDALSWQQPVEIVGASAGPQQISRDEAISIAREQPAYETFRLAHSGEAIAKISDGKYFINFGGVWEQVTYELYQETQNKQMAPGANATWSDGNWVVVFMDKLGDPPNSLSITVDGVSGAVLAVS
jgi:hypothetical protein